MAPEKSSILGEFSQSAYSVFKDLLRYSPVCPSKFSSSMNTTNQAIIYSYDFNSRLGLSPAPQFHRPIPAGEDFVSLSSSTLVPS